MHTKFTFYLLFLSLGLLFTHCQNNTTQKKKKVHPDLSSNFPTYEQHKEAVATNPNFYKIPISQINEQEVVLAGQDYEIQLKKAIFNPKKHTIQYKKEAPDCIEQIDGFTKFWGTTCQLPTNTITNVAIKHQGQTIEIPPTIYTDLFNLNWESKTDKNAPKATLSKDKKQLTIKLKGGYKANGSAYGVTWAFRDGAYNNRFIER